MSETKTRKFCTVCGDLPEDDSEVCPKDGTPLKVTDEDSLIGAVLSQRYRIDSLLGMGGMGAVYKATHIALNRIVAIKVLRIHVGDNERERIQRFNQEGRLISALQHPNIIGAMDFGVDNGKIFLVMEYVQGDCLMDVITNDGRLTSMRALDIFVQISEALAYAHSQGVIHRDIKPSNVMLTRDEQGRESVKLLDFGVAKILQPEKTQFQAPLTKTGIVFGSPPYMSPEQCLGQAPDARSDVYSLGCVMYEVLSGSLPIDGENSLEILHKQIIAVPLEFRQLSPAIPLAKGLEAIIFKALDKNVDTRYQSMDELRNDLIRFKQDHHFSPARSNRTDSSSSFNDGQAPMFAIAALTLLAVVIFIFTSPRSASQRVNSAVAPSPAQTQLKLSVPQTVPTNDNEADEPTTAEEKALSKAVLSLTHMLERNGQGRQAQAKLEQVLRSERQSLPADDPALQDIRNIESGIDAVRQTRHPR